VTEKEKRELWNSKRELALTLGTYIKEYRTRRTKLIKLRTGQRKMEKLKNVEHAEAYAQSAQAELPLINVLLGEITTMQAMLRNLNELAA